MPTFEAAFRRLFIDLGHCPTEKIGREPVRGRDRLIRFLSDP